MTSLLNVHLSVREVVNDVASSPPGPVVPAAVGVVVWSVVRAIRDVIETEKSNFGFFFCCKVDIQIAFFICLFFSCWLRPCKILKGVV